MGTTNHFDLIVLGGDLSGLVAAALAAGRGLRVCVLPGDAPEGTVKVGHRHFPINAAPFTAVSSPFVRVVYEELGLWLQTRRDVRPLEGLHHWRLPNISLDVRSGEENLDREISRATASGSAPLPPDLCPRVSAFMDANMQELFRAAGLEPPVHRSVAGGDDAPSELPEVSEASRALASTVLGVDTLAGWLADAPPSGIATPICHRLRTQWAEGPTDFVGGLPALRAQLIARIQSRSSEVKPRIHIDRIDVKRGRVSGVKLRGKDEHYGCDALLLACDPVDVFGTAAEAGSLSKDFARRLAGVQRPLRRYVLHVAVGNAGVSPVFSTTLLTACESAETSGIEGLFLRRMDPSQVDAGDDAACISVTALAPTTIPTAELRTRTLDALRRHGGLPFLESHLRWTYSPHDGFGIIDGPQDDPSAASGSKRPYGMEQLYAFEGAGVGGGLPIETGVKRLLYAGRMSYPQLGMEGQYIAALAAADGLSASKKGAASPRLMRR
ncbi:MAG: hypothetical protein ACPHRO_02815 [Nannocystaceae bacterium]